MPELPTRASIIVDAARKSGLLSYEGTATAGASGTLTDTNVLIHPSNNDLRGFEIYIHTGNAAGDVRVTSASTSSSSLVTVSPNWSSTPNTTSQYLMFRRREGALITRLILDGIDGGMRHIRKRFLTSKTNLEYVLQDLLWGYGAMQRWTNGASAAPDGWTLAGSGAAAARSTTIPNQLTYSAQVTSGSSNTASLSRSIAQYGQYHDLSASLYGWIRANVASRVTLRVTDGVSTNNSDALTTVDTWYEVGPGKDIDLSVLNIGTNPTELTASLQISTGSAVVATVSDLRLILSGRTLQRFELPATNGYGGDLTSFQWIHTVLVEDPPQSWVFPRSSFISPQHLNVVYEEGTRFLYVLLSDLTGLANRRLFIQGQEGPPILTSNSGTTSVDSDYLSAYAAWYALRSLTNKSNNERETLARLEQEWREIDRLIRGKPVAGSIPVEKT